MNSDCAVALGWKPEGKKSRGRPKTTDRNGTHGQERGRQQTTASCGEKMFGPCVPPGTRRFNFNFCLHVYLSLIETSVRHSVFHVTEEII